MNVDDVYDVVLEEGGAPEETGRRRLCTGWLVPL